MKQLWWLVKLQLVSRFGVDEIKHAADPKRKRKSVTALIAYAYVIGVCAFISTTYSAAMLTTLSSLGLASLLPAMFVLSVTLLGLFNGLSQVKSVVFGFGDLDMTISLPLPIRTVVAARLFNYYLLDFIITLAFMLPVGIVAGIGMDAPVSYYILYVLALPFVPFVPLAIGGVLGTLLSAALARTRAKNAFSTVMQFVVVGGIMYFSFSSTDFLEGFTDIAGSLTARISSLYPPAAWFSDGVSGEPLKLVAFIGLSVAAALAFAVPLTLNFQRLNGIVNATYTRRGFVLSRQKRSSKLSALYKRELKRYFASPIYVTNTAFGVIIGFLAVGFFCTFGRDMLAELLTNFGGMDYAPQVAAIALTMLMGLSPTTCSSVSLEGKGLWLVKQLPIPANDWFRSKIMVGLTFTLPAIVIAAIALSLSFGFSPLSALTLLFAPLCALYLSVVVGLALNLKRPNFNWSTEQECVKGDLPVLLSMLVDMLLVGVMVVVSVTGFGEMGLVAAAAVMLVLAILIRSGLARKAEAIRLKL